jgi:putative ABC transport system permease protein
VVRLLFDIGLALRALVEQPLRTALTLLGIVIGIVALVTMMALIDALGVSIGQATAPLGVGVFQAQREPRFGSSGNAGEGRAPFTLADHRALAARLTLTGAIDGEMWSWGRSLRARGRRTNPVCGVAGVMPGFLAANGIELSRGRFLDARDLATRRPVAVIGSDVVRTLFPGGEAEALGAELRIGDRPYTVIGTMADRPALFGAAWRNCLAAVPIGAFERDLGFRSLHLTFVPRDGARLEEAMDEAIAALRQLRRVKPGEPNDFELFSNESSGATLGMLTMVTTVAAGVICVIALVVGGVGVMNILLVSVMERTREIGIRKALGARPSAILVQFVTEAVVLSAIGGAVGVGLAYAVVEVAALALELPAVVPPWAVALALASSALVGLGAGIQPARRAARLDPLEALRHE